MKKVLKASWGLLLAVCIYVLYVSDRIILSPIFVTQPKLSIWATVSDWHLRAVIRLLIIVLILSFFI